MSRALLCKQSPYFAAMFLGDFKERDTQSTTVDETDSVVLTRSFKMLVQWVCISSIIFEDSPPDKAISTSIKFARMADICGITGMEYQVAEHIKSVILADAALRQPICERDHKANTYLVTAQHIAWASLLSKGYLVRSALAMASVEEFLLLEDYGLLKSLKMFPALRQIFLQLSKSP